MYHFIVRQTQQKLLRVRIYHRKRQLIVMRTAVNRVIFHIFRKIIHPAHVPLIVETKAFVIEISRHLRPCGRLLCDEKRIRELFFEDRIQVFQKLDCLEVLISAVDVGDPLAVLLAVIEIQHRGNGIHTDSVSVVLFRPEQSVRDQEVLDFRSSVVVDQCSPVRMGPLSRIKVLVQACSVESGKTERITREVCRYPVEDNADSVLMHRVHKVTEVIRCSVSCGRCVITRHLITPGLVQRMFHHRHQFYMCIAKFFDIGSQHRRDLAVVVEFTAVVRLFPGAEMYLVNGHRRFVTLGNGAVLHPGFILPLVFSKVEHNARIVRAELCCVRIRVGFQIRQAALCLDFVFVNVSDTDTRDKEFVDAGFQKVHLVCSSVPVVEVSDNTHADRVWRPDSEVNAADAVDLYRMCAQFFIN